MAAIFWRETEKVRAGTRLAKGVTVDDDDAETRNVNTKLMKQKEAIAWVSMKKGDVMLGVKRKEKFASWKRLAFVAT